VLEKAQAETLAKAQERGGKLEGFSCRSRRRRGSTGVCSAR